MKRIDTAQAPNELSKALEEFTGKKVSGLTLGKPYEIEGGGMGRSISARLDGELKAFVAVEQQGKVGIYDARFAPHAEQVHKLLGQSDEAFKKVSRLASKTQSNKFSQGSGDSKVTPALAWPEREAKAARNITSARTRRH